MTNKEHYLGGVHALMNALQQNILKKLYVAANKNSKNVNILRAAAAEKNIAIEIVAAHHLDYLLPQVKHQGVVGLCAFTANDNSWQQAIAGVSLPLLLILDSIQDPHNLGACLRSSAAAGVNAVILAKSRSAQLSAVVHRVACGAVQHLNIITVANIKREICAMQQRGICVIAAAEESNSSLYATDFKMPLALVVGNEGSGIAPNIRQQCDQSISIPCNENMPSLNVSVATAIMLFEIKRQRNLF